MCHKYCLHRITCHIYPPTEKNSKAYRSVPSTCDISASPDLPLTVSGSTVHLSLLVNFLISFQKSLESLCNNDWAKVSDSFLLILSLHCRTRYLNLALMDFIMWKRGPVLGLPFVDHKIKASLDN